MAFDYQRALEAAVQPINTLAQGILDNGRSKSQGLFALALENRRREQQLADQKEAREFQKMTLKEQREYMEGKDKENRTHQEKLAKEEREFRKQQAKDDNEAKIAQVEAQSKAMVDRMTAQQREQTISRISTNTGLIKRKDESEQEFILRAAKIEAEGINDLFKEKNALEKEYEDLNEKAEIRRREIITNNATSDPTFMGLLNRDQLAALKTPESKGGVSVYKLIGDVQAKDPDLAAKLQIEYSRALTAAEERVGDVVPQEYRPKIRQLSKGLDALNQTIQVKTRNLNVSEASQYIDFGREKPSPNIEDLTAPTPDALDQFIKPKISTVSEPNSASTILAVPPVPPQSGFSSRMQTFFPQATLAGRFLQGGIVETADQRRQNILNQAGTNQPVQAVGTTPPQPTNSFGVQAPVGLTNTPTASQPTQPRGQVIPPSPAEELQMRDLALRKGYTEQGIAAKLESVKQGDQQSIAEVLAILEEVRATGRSAATLAPMQ